MDNNLINLTAHDIVILDEAGKEVKVIQTTGVIACNKEVEVVSYIDDIPIVETRYGDVVNMPDMEEGQYFIVSKVVAEKLKLLGRTMDILVPEKLVRDRGGSIRGCKYLARV